MPESKVHYSRVLEDDPSPLHEALAAGLKRPLILWGHAEVGQSAIVRTAAETAGLPFRTFEAAEFEKWDGFRDVSASGHFRPVSLENFLEKGERADPAAFTFEPGQVLYIKGLNRIGTRLVGTVFDQVFDEEKLLNNYLPERFRIVATALPFERQAALELLGPVLREVWNGMRNHASLKYEASPLPKRLKDGADHWAVLPSVKRFVAWGRRQALAEEVLGFLEDLHVLDPPRALLALHAETVCKGDDFRQLASPRSFIELGSLLAERRLYFSSRAVKQALARASSARDFLGWFHGHLSEWDPDRWIDADGGQTLRGEPVTGSVWLRALIDSVRRGESTIGLDDLPTYAALERSSLRSWATQELGEELGAEMVQATSVTAADLAALRR